MLTRPLMLNPPALQAPARTAGQYVTPAGRFYRMTYDAALDRLNFFRVRASAFNDLVTSVSSGAQVAALTAAGRVGIWNVGSTGLAAAPVADYAYPPFVTGYQLHSVNAAADALYTGSGGSFLIRNLATGASSGAIPGQSGFSTASFTYGTGDGWVAQIQQANGTQPGTTPWSYETSANVTRLRIAYAVNSAGATALARVAPGGLQALPFTGVPRVLDRANTVFWVRVVLGDVTRAFGRQSFVATSATVDVDEIDVEMLEDGSALVSMVRASWYGIVRADLTGASFVPLSVFYSRRDAVPCSVANGLYTSRAQQWGSGRDVFVGQYSLLASALLPGAVGLFRGPGVADPATGATLAARFRSVSLDGTTLVDGPPPSGGGGGLIGIPHLGALLAYTANSTAAMISFDAGATWRAVTTFRSASDNTAPVLGVPDWADLRAATPLFIV
ncbi:MULTISPECIES: hypothetical protein [Methylobacteriaceae]|uniref:Uncharacterized protein n=2 Tax=Methylobacteriaceae TaxID=119045 RepID=A0AA37MFV1_9HYPH|nr:MULTISPECIES: hypothetical protein [Methylobacteriaceae]MDQ0520071.1 hypothetical protein [Methylobacterium gregans]BAU90643.1 hypothetical protein MPPM_2038 [Methylorubrum populi]GJD81224.1 hypothetical protein NBEOAGPD_4470 [Methylobacterium gregans]GLS52472.1 hypothetical protein GCM10007886_06550 [Methylobacterium gregans]